MNNEMKIRVRCMPNPEIKQTVRAYDELNSLIFASIDGDIEELYETFGMDPEDDTLDFDDLSFIGDEDFNIAHPENALGIEFAFTALNGLPEYQIFDVFETVLPLSHKVVFSITDETAIPDMKYDGIDTWTLNQLDNPEIAGCINTRIVGWREEDNIPLWAEEIPDCPMKDKIFCFPENDKMKHEMFLMTFNEGTPFSPDPNFMNQKNLDDAYIRDEEGNLPTLDDWMDALYSIKTNESSIG